jgi:O-phosphoseryl-tRNA(Cys) synthetase
MSFVEEPDVLAVMEEYFKEMTKLFPNKKIKTLRSERRLYS